MSDHLTGSDRFYPPVLVTRRRLSVWRWVLPFLLLAMGLRFMPAMFGELAAADAPAPAEVTSAQAAIANLIERPGETFPGSAYFFAEDAFRQSEATDGANGLDARWRGNRHILAIDIGPPAPSHRFSGRNAIDRYRALNCLTNTIYYEAANEPEEGQRAVAQVVINRLRHPDWPDSICGVVYEGTERADLRCQFTFSCDGSMGRVPDPAKWLRARRVAEAALRGEVFAPAGLATYYHTLTVFPNWATRMQPSAIIGAHIFYRSPGASGLPGQFRDRYAGVETIDGPSPHAYLDPRDMAPAPPAPVVKAAVAVPLASAPQPAPPSVPVSLPTALPRSGDVKPEWLNSGRPIQRP